VGKTGLVRVLGWASGVLGVVLVLLLAFAGYLWHLSARLPNLAADPDAIQMAQTSIVYAADGSVLAEWHDAEDRIVIPAESIPQSLKDAAVAIEDRRFYEHSGVDMHAIARAVSVNTAAGEVRQGGSTITQQTVKLLFTDGERTLTRKIEEALLALQLESQADKDDVLGVYLNMVYFGHGAYGAESAAQRSSASAPAISRSRSRPCSRDASSHPRATTHSPTRRKRSRGGTWCCVRCATRATSQPVRRPTPQPSRSA